jgi:hypothetical protein
LLFFGRETSRTSLSEIYLGRKIIATSGKGLIPVIVNDDWIAGGRKKERKQASVTV